MASETRQEEKVSLSIYPNPSINILNVEIAHLKSEEAQLTIRDLQGKIISGKSISMGAESSKILNLDVSNLASGVYFLQFQSESHQQIDKIVIK